MKNKFYSITHLFQAQFLVTSAIIQNTKNIVVCRPGLRGELNDKQDRWIKCQCKQEKPAF
jgi:hypothetical protein